MRALFQPPTDDHAISALQAFGWHALTGTNAVAADGGLCANRPVVADERTSSTPELRRWRPGGEILSADYCSATSSRYPASISPRLMRSL
jgi:hypothetical protein